MSDLKDPIGSYKLEGAFCTTGIIADSHLYLDGEMNL